jgi:hypothetical protein
MRKIKLANQERYAICDDADFNFLNRFKWYLENERYAVAVVDGNRIKMHRLLLSNILSKEITVDHIDGDSLNNRRSNLRLANMSQQNWNRSKTKENTTSRYKGVDWYDKYKCWRTRISYKNQTQHIGYFSSEIEAARQYNKYASKYFGKYARLNKIEEDYVVPVCLMAI